MNTLLMNRLLIPAFLIVLLVTPPLNAQSKTASVSAKAKAKANPAVKSRQPKTELWRRTELFFGCSKPDGSNISEKHFLQFVSTEITPRFPNGLTVLPSRGQYLDTSGTLVKERSMQIILFYPTAMRDANRKIEEIRAAYKLAFQQESVLRVDTTALVSF